MAVNQARLTHYASDDPDVIDEEIWMDYLTLRRLGRLLEKLKERCAEYIGPQETIRHLLLEIEQTDSGRLRSWLHEIDSEMELEPATFADDDSTLGFRVSPDWERAEVEITPTVHELRLHPTPQDHDPEPNPDPSWEVELRVNIFQQDMVDFADWWLQAQLEEGNIG